MQPDSPYEMAKRGRPRKPRLISSRIYGGIDTLMQMLGPQGLKGMEAIGPVECHGYGITLTPWGCIENQLSDFCLPGFPCHDCETGVTIRTAGRMPVPLEKANRKLKTENRKQVLKGMSRAVARDLGLI